ncbi:amino-acid N-acetyltransferase [Methylomarinovum tepidoasis]|uniref:Amino-acid acetyltransferase n=1 Tax=Methylomarinovum tepidoasis TaxID=2840183 RepID=A0AAU9CFJ5_9GAMM|nr:amino-acid N-acetyltransferase [Methylomarinovum sp. IN45]BCX89003.1 amino-acid N-acetyltransferase [Methylomarinovum sp. IN45]
MIDPAAFVRWFRGALPYIHAHRGRTFVIHFGGEAVADEPRFASLVHDIALLHGLGIRLVLVPGIRPQIETRLQRRGIACRYHRGQRITDATALECVKEAAGQVRVEIEARLSLGVADSPMAGMRLPVISGNFITAKPLGVIDGIDFQYTGEVRRVDAAGIQALLAQERLVLIPPLGYSPTGEVFNLRAETVATAVATALKADKFLILMERPCYLDEEPVAQLTSSEARTHLNQARFPAPVAPHVEAAVTAAEGGVERVHLLDRHLDGALLLELFTRDGAGTLISRQPFESLRPARLDDIPGILELIAPLEREGVLVKRSREKLEMDLADYCVIERDGLVIGCAALHAFPEVKMGELACLALHPDYRGENRGRRLLEHIEAQAHRQGLERLFVLTTRTLHWFRERGFRPAAFTDLPVQRQRCYNAQRNSKVLIKCL